MTFKFQISDFKFQICCRIVFNNSALLSVCVLILLFSVSVFAQNDLQKIADGGHVEKWLVSNEFPAEIDAGLWENFNRFNIETLPRKDWLAPFGSIQNIKPQVGIFKATIDTKNNSQTQIQNPKLRADLPEVGEVSSAKTLPDATEISWREVILQNPRIDFFNLNGGKTIGTAYAAAYVDAAKDEIRFIETDGFLGAIWLNGEKIYDGFSLNVKKIAAAKFRAGKNLLIVRGTGVSGDYWRKDGGWTAQIKFRTTEQAGNIVFGALRNSERVQESFIGKIRNGKFDSYLESVYLITLLNLSETDEEKIEIKLSAKEGNSSSSRGGYSSKAKTLTDAEIGIVGVFSGVRPALLTVTTNRKESKTLETFYSSSKLNYGTIFYLEGFHVDPVYLQDQRGYSKITLSNTNQYVQSLRADPRYGVFLSEIDYLKPYLDTHPEDREFLREAVRQGRVGTGGAYNQFNELNIGGEAIIRNILYGQEMHNAMVGRKSKSLALWDVFGHAPQLSQIMNKSGFTGVVWSKKITGFQPFFYDYALDGSRALHRRVDYAYSFSGFGSGKNYSFDNFRKMTERKFEETQSFGSSVDLRINAADFTPPWTNLAGNVEKLESQKPQIRVSGQAQDLFFDAAAEEIKLGKVKPPVTSRDKLFFHVGVMMARSDLKVAHRHTENMTLTAEKFGAIAYLRGAKYPDLALDKAWRQIFFGSHHDAITGTPSDSALLDLVHGYREAFELSKNALDDSLKFIAKQIDTKADSKFQIPNSRLIPIVVFNPMNWTRNDVVTAKVETSQITIRDAKGKTIPHRVISNNKIEFIAENVPSLGYKTFYAESNPFGVVEFGGLSSNSALKVIENEFYKITVDSRKGGAISSIFDKQAQREIINTTNGNFGNEIASLKEELTRKNVIYPAWEMWTTGEKKFSTEKAAQVVQRQFNDSQTLTIDGELPNMQKFVQTISLHKNVKRIDFKTELVGYKDKDELFVVNFPLNLTGGALVTEDRFGTVVRNSSKGFLDFKTNTDKLVSGAPVYGINNWAEYGSTLTLNFVGRGDAETVRSGDKEKNLSASPPIASVPFKPTALVRPHGEIYESATETIVANLIKRGVSVTPFYDDNDAARRKNLTIEDSTMPKTLNDDIAYHGFRIALGGESENVYSAKLLKQISAETLGKFNERLQRDGFAFLFLYDKEIPAGWRAIPTLLIVGDVQKATANLIAPIGEQKFELNLPFETFATETNPEKVLPNVPNYGVALINNGTPAVSLENPDTLTLHLTHTAAFPGVNLPFEFVPENKTHVFEYALYPHAKDWREADTVKVGYDFNNPLIAVQTDIHEGKLPNEHSFFTNNYEKNGNVVLTTFKVGENPLANFKTKQLENRRSFVLRFNEAEGRNKTPLYFTFSPQPLTKDDYNFHDVFWKLTPTDLLENELNGGKSDRNTNMSAAKFLRGIEGFGIETFSLKVDGQVEKKEFEKRQEIGATKEPIQPVFSSYWLHNSGAAPIGNDAVKVSLRPTEQMGNLSTFSWDDPYNQGGITTVGGRVQVVNNYQDRNISGEIALEVPEDWRVVPDKIAYEIAANGSFTKDVVITAFPVKRNLEFERASGLIKAKIEHDGQIFQDVLQIGKPFKLEWRTEKTADGVSIHIKNPHRQTIEGAVALVKPYENWLFDEPNAPREIGFSVAPRSEITLKFAKNLSDADSWAIARIAYNGWVEYLRADDFEVIPVKK
jgi:alpha-mannosidase